MNSKKILLLICAILQVVCILLMFMPGVFTQEYWRTSDDVPGAYTHISSRDNVINAFPEGKAAGFGVATILCSSVAATFAFLAFANKNMFLKCICVPAFLSIITAALHAYYVVGNNPLSYLSYHYTYEMNTLLYFIFIFLVASAIISLVVMSKKFNKENNQ